MSDPTRPARDENACDPVSIDAVAAVEATSAKLRRIRTELGEEVFTLAALIDNRFAWGPSDPDAAVEVAREALAALRSAGWLRTAEDRAVLDAAERYYEGLGEKVRDWMIAFREDVDLSWVDARADLMLAVRARRVAAGGTVPTDPPREAS